MRIFSCVPGKTTVFKLIAGIEKPDEGQVSIDPDVVVGYFSQDTGEMGGRSVMAEVLSGAGRVHDLKEKLELLEHRMSDPSGEGLSESEMNEYGGIQLEFSGLGGYELESRAEAILTGLGFGRERWEEAVESFSGGWKMRIALAKILLEALQDFEGTVMIVSHDRYFLKHLANRVFEIDRGSLRVYERGYEYYLDKRERLTSVGD
jgi:ATP-binding cassette subfamily F protein 3